jgi:uncharacterized protein (TIGR03663 family)
MFLRFYELPLKPMHHDEGVNALLLTNLVRPPHVYRYDPANYHGPTLFYLASLSTVAFGLTTVAIRFVTALAGLVAVLAVLALRRQVGAVGSIAAAALLAVSPGAVYFSRYFIHEMLLVCFTLAMVVAAAEWWHRGRAFHLHLAAVFAGLMFATKETALISAVVLIGAVVGTGLFFQARGRTRAGARAEFGRHRVVDAPGDRRSLLRLAQAIGLFLVVNLLFYTSFFEHWQGGIDAFKTLAFWTKAGTTAHIGPWYAYIDWLSAEELPLLLLGGVGAALALWRADDRFAVFAALWGVGILAAYSLIPYKTPWLALNMIAPLAVTGGYACEMLWRRRRTVPRGVLAATAAVLAGVATFQAVVLTFVQYDNGRHPYVYAHTFRDVLTLVEEIREIQARNPGSPIAITSEDHFPLSWYLLAYPVGYYGRPVVTGDPLVIASEQQQDTLDRSLGTRYERVGSYRLRPGVRLVLYVRRDLRRGAPR